MKTQLWTWFIRNPPPEDDGGEPPPSPLAGTARSVSPLHFSRSAISRRERPLTRRPRVRSLLGRLFS